MSCKVAREYDQMLKEYEALKAEIEIKMFDPDFNEYTSTLLESIEAIRKRIVEFNTRYICNGHYVIPDNEFTKH